MKISIIINFILFTVFGFLCPITAPIIIIISLYFNKLLYVTAYIILCIILLDYYLKTEKDFLRKQFNDYFTMVYLTPTNSIDEDRKKIVIVGPHGLFCFSACTDFIKNSGNKFTMLIDNILAYNPIINILCNSTGLKIIGLTDSNIKKELNAKNDRNYLVAPGGFIEAALGSKNISPMYTDKYPYWIKKAINNDYDICFSWYYGETQMYRQGDEYIDTRKFLSSMNIPFINPFSGIFYTPMPYNNIPLYHIGFKKTFPHLPNASLNECKPYILEFYQEISDLFKKYPSPNGIAPVVLLKELSFDGEKINDCSLPIY
jgi:hypothetical protein